MLQQKIFKPSMGLRAFWSQRIKILYIKMFIKWYILFTHFIPGYFSSLVYKHDLILFALVINFKSWIKILICTNITFLVSFIFVNTTTLLSQLTFSLVLVILPVEIIWSTIHSIHTIVNTICLLPKLLQDLNKSFSQTLPDSTRLHCKIIQESVTLKPKKNIVFKHLLGANTPWWCWGLSVNCTWSCYRFQ